ncbi:hypothetical protein GTA08_BOTSDO12949 [Botryosphaeria dothidea]|uniref:Invertebrate defensins family profile domain-containing protein n=1 Tax=Botryosphaeria dothidea TaxID=55169 RepID=A0A8H4J216_9PEZI|nr:hypothetical protein GTA08_BOTSDO12949 [Botryosphaeria dothidea]
MAPLNKLFGILSLIACASSAAIDSEALAARGLTISIKTSDNERSGASNLDPFAPAGCSDGTCSQVCYQHGGAFGGRCDGDQCICNKPGHSSLEQSVLRPNNDVHPTATCNSYSE